MKLNSYRGNQGFTTVESLMSLLLSSIILAAAVTTFTFQSRVSSDQKFKTIAQLQAQSVVDMMVPEFRMIGNGVPFHQSNFLIAQADLTDNTVTQPILVSGTTATQIKFRLNETGETYILTADNDPALSNTLTLTSVDKISIGSQVYVTNSTVGDDDGLWGQVTTINSTAKTITLAAGHQYKPLATFAKGSLLEVVPVITYASGASYGGITRNNGSGALTLVPNAQFSLAYINSAAGAITLPLLASSADPFPASAIQNLRSIRITAQVRTSRILSNKQYYVASVTQSVGIRNLNYKY